MMIAPSVCGMPIPTSTWLPWKGILVVCGVSPSTATSSSLLDDRTIRVWNADTHEHLATMEGHTGGVLVSHPLRQQALLCWWLYDRTIRVWDADTHEHLATMEGHTGAVLCLTLYGNKLFSGGGDDRTIRVWNADTHEHLATMEGHTGGVWCLTLYGNKLFSAGGYGDSTIRVWNVKED